MSTLISYGEIPFYFDMITDVNLHPTVPSSILITGLIEGDERQMEITVDIKNLAEVKEQLKARMNVLSVRPADYHERTIH